MTYFKCIVLNKAINIKIIQPEKKISKKPNSKENSKRKNGKIKSSNTPKCA